MTFNKHKMVAHWIFSHSLLFSIAAIQTLYTAHIYTHTRTIILFNCLNLYEKIQSNCRDYTHFTLCKSSWFWFVLWYVWCFCRLLSTVVDCFCCWKNWNLPNEREGGRKTKSILNFVSKFITFFFIIFVDSFGSAFNPKNASLKHKQKWVSYRFYIVNPSKSSEYYQYMVNSNYNIFHLDGPIDRKLWKSISESVRQTNRSRLFNW